MGAQVNYHAHAFVENSGLPGKCIRCGAKELNPAHYPTESDFLLAWTMEYWPIIAALFLLTIILVAK